MFLRAPGKRGKVESEAEENLRRGGPPAENPSARDRFFDDFESYYYARRTGESPGAGGGSGSGVRGGRAGQRDFVTTPETYAVPQATIRPPVREPAAPYAPTINDAYASSPPSDTEQAANRLSAAPPGPGIRRVILPQPASKADFADEEASAVPESLSPEGTDDASFRKSVSPTAETDFRTDEPPESATHAATDDDEVRKHAKSDIETTGESDEMTVGAAKAATVERSKAFAYPRTDEAGRADEAQSIDKADAADDTGIDNDLAERSDFEPFSCDQEVGFERPVIRRIRLEDLIPRGVSSKTPEEPEATDVTAAASPAGEQTAESAETSATIETEIEVQASPEPEPEPEDEPEKVEQATDRIEILPAYEQALLLDDEAEGPKARRREAAAGGKASRNTERISFPAGSETELDSGAVGLVSDEKYVPTPSTKSLENTDFIEIHRVLSAARPLVKEELLSKREAASDSDDQGEGSAALKADERSSDSAASAPGSWLDRIPKPKELKDSLAKAGAAVKPAKESIDQRISLPFRLRPLPANFDKMSEARRQGVLQLYRLEAETRGLLLTGAVIFAVLSFLWLLLPSTFMGILKNQVSGRLIYELLRLGLVLLVPLTAFAKHQAFPLGRIFGPVMPSGSQYFTAALIGVPLAVLCLSLQNLFIAAVPGLYAGNLNRYMYMPHSLRPGSTVILWCVLLVLPAFLEELFFRGSLFTGLLRQGHLRTAYIMPALLYAFHYRDPVFFIPFLAAVTLSQIRRYSASLFPCIVARLTFGFTFFFFYQNVPVFVRTMPLSSAAGQIGLYASITAAVVSAVTLLGLLAFLGTLQSPEQSAEFSAVRPSRRRLITMREIRIAFLLSFLTYLLNIGLF